MSKEVWWYSMKTGATSLCGTGGGHGHALLGTPVQGCASMCPMPPALPGQPSQMATFLWPRFCCPKQWAFCSKTADVNSHLSSVKAGCVSRHLQGTGMAATEGEVLEQAGDPAGQNQNSKWLHSPLKSKWAKSCPALMASVLHDFFTRVWGEQLIWKN